MRRPRLPSFTTTAAVLAAGLAAAVLAPAGAQAAASRVQAAPGGSSGLWFSDATQGGWTAGQDGDCIGLIVSSWSGSQVVFGFGSEYANYPAIQSGDQVEVDVQGATFSGPLT